MLVKGDSEKAVIKARTQENALSYYRGRFEKTGVVIKKRKDHYTIEVKK